MGIEIESFSCLEYLNLSNCHLISLPRSIGNMENLKELVLSKNSLSNLPLLSESLEILDISFNMFSVIPEHLETLPNLYYLYSEGNPLKNPNATIKFSGKASDGATCLDKKVPMSRIRFTQNELNTLGTQFLNLSQGKSFVTFEAFQSYLEITHIDDPLFLESLFRSFTKFSSKTDQLDVTAFLFAMGILLKGTLKEKIQCKGKLSLT